MKLYLTVLLIFFCSTKLYAYEVDVKGFLTFAYSVSSSEVAYSGNITDDGEYSEGTKAGLQFSSVLSPKVDVFLQMLSDGNNGRDFNFALDIAHVNYNINNDHKILYGKIRLPVWLISDYRQVGSLYPWINPPEEVYEVAPLEDVGANDTFFGISFEGKIFQSGLNKINYRLYTGGSERVSDKEDASGTTEVRIKNLHGAQISYSHSDLYMKLSYLNINSDGDRFDFDEDDFIPAQAFRTEYSTFGLKYDNDLILVMSEISNVKGDTKEVESLQSYYIMGGLYLSDNDILIHSTFSKVLESSKTNRDIYQRTISFGVNYNLDISTILKFEHQTIHLENDERFKPGETAPRKAGFFKGHPGEDVNIFSVSINTMF